MWPLDFSDYFLEDHQECDTLATWNVHGTRKTIEFQHIACAGLEKNLMSSGVHLPLAFTRAMLKSNEVVFVANLLDLSRNDMRGK